MHGPLAVRDLRTGAEIVELEGLCTWDAAYRCLRSSRRGALPIRSSRSGSGRGG